jgi:hypothetical protein
MTNHKHSLEKLMNSSRNLPWLAGAVVACAVLAAPAARAQTTTQLTTAPTSTVGAPSLIKTAPQAGAIAIGGAQIVALPSTTAPEAISVSAGTASITDTVSLDPNGGTAVVEELVDLRGCTFKGAKSLGTYHTSGFARITRQLAATDQYVGTLPIWITTAAGVTSYYTMTFILNTAHNITTNVLTSASLALGDYVAPSTAGGTTVGGTIQ